MRRAWIAGVVLSLGVVGYACGQKPTEGPPPAPPGEARGQEPRAAAQDFKRTDLNGTPLTLSSFRGKVVLLDFWATWCPPCVEEIPQFKELHATYKDKGLQVIGISMDVGGPEAVKSFVKSNGISYSIAMGDEYIARAYGGVVGLPTTFLIDKKGRIAKKFYGYRPKSFFEKEIQALLAE